MKNKLKSTLLILLMSATLSLTNTGCAVKSALNQPNKKDLSVFDKGTPRYEVASELGKAIDIQKNDDGTTTDTYSFIQGYSKNVKVGRAIGHTIMDIVSFGLWEVIGTPAEVIVNGDKVVVRVKYDKSELVDKVTVIKGKEEL